MSSRDRPKRVSPTPATVAQALATKGRADGPSATASAKPSTKGKIQCRTTVQRTTSTRSGTRTDTACSVIIGRDSSPENRVRAPGRQPWRSSDGYCRQSPTLMPLSPMSNDGLPLALVLQTGREEATMHYIRLTVTALAIGCGCPAPSSAQPGQTDLSTALEQRSAHFSRSYLQLWSSGSRAALVQVPPALRPAGPLLWPGPEPA